MAGYHQRPNHSRGESLQLQERNSYGSPPHDLHLVTENTGVSPFADPSEEPRSPFEDSGSLQSPFADKHRVHRVRAPQASIDDYAAAGISPFADPVEPKRAASFHSAMSTKEVHHSPLMAEEYANRGRPPKVIMVERKSRRRTYIIIGAVVLVVVIIVAIIAGVVAGKKKTTSNAGSQGYSTLPGSAGAVLFSNPNDPSTYVKDARLQNSFYGITYTPLNAQAPECGAVQANVTEDIVLLSQLTTHIRMFSEECNQSAMVLQAIKDTKVNLEVYLAINLTLNTTEFFNEAGGIQQAVLNYGPSNVAGILVGNQFVSDYLTTHNTSDPNSTYGAQAAVFVAAMMATMRASMAFLNLTKPIPVGTADGGNLFTPILLEEVDFAMASIMPSVGVGGIDVSAASGYVQGFFQEYAVSTAKQTSNNPPMYIGQTGWPTNSTNQQDVTGSGASAASVANLQEYINTFVCSANQNSTKYFYFDYFDELWRQETFGGTLGSYGLFTSDKQLKNLTIPSCSHL